MLLLGGLGAFAKASVIVRVPSIPGEACRQIRHAAHLQKARRRVCAARQALQILLAHFARASSRHRRWKKPSQRSQMKVMEAVTKLHTAEQSLRRLLRQTPSATDSAVAHSVTLDWGLAAARESCEPRLAPLQHPMPLQMERSPTTGANGDLALATLAMSLAAEWESSVPREAVPEAHPLPMQLNLSLASRDARGSASAAARPPPSQRHSEASPTTTTSPASSSRSLSSYLPRLRLSGASLSEAAPPAKPLAAYLPQPPRSSEEDEGVDNTQLAATMRGSPPLCRCGEFGHDGLLVFVWFFKTACLH